MVLDFHFASPGCYLRCAPCRAEPRSVPAFSPSAASAGLSCCSPIPAGPIGAARDAGAWSIPKGLVEFGDPLTCAKREFNEETGLTAKGAFIPLTPTRQKSGKTVHAFALEADFDLTDFSSNAFEMEWPPRSGKMQSFPEVDRIAYFKLATARRKICPRKGRSSRNW